MHTLYQALLLKKLYLLQTCGFTYCAPQVQAPMQKGFLAKNPKDLKNIVETCKLCPKNSKEMPSFGLCNENSKLVFATLEPLLDSQMRFNSHASIMLKNIVEKVFFLTLRDVSILSLLKCQIPTNSREGGIEFCLEYFFKQLEFTDANIIITLGESAYYNLTKDENCKDRQYYEKIRGSLLSFGKWRVFPTDSLHSLVRQKEHKARAHKEFLYLKQILER